MMKKSSTILMAILPVLACFALLQGARAVSPAPDGCYPAFTTAEGCNALAVLTTGIGNTAVGWYSLFSTATGSFNTGVGGGALALNNGDSNTAVGAAALLLNTAGTQNTANGTDALLNNASGNYNDAVGAFALFYNISGSGNNAFGNSALSENVKASYNTAIGDLALLSNDSDKAGTANFNTAVGSGALAANIDGGGNTALGVDTLANNNNGEFLTAVGADALFANTYGRLNTAIGSGALVFNTTGSYNTALGLDAGSNVTTANNVICIGAPGNNVDNSCFINNIFASTSSDGVAVLVNQDGKLGTVTSSARFKDQIKPMNRASEVLFALKPVSFRYKREIDPAGSLQLGLVAEDVEKVNRELVVRDKEGKPYSVRYDQVNAMLLNEFLKEHTTVQELKKEVAALTATVKEQAAQIQKVSAQLEASKPAPQMVNNQ
jgi:Chaperone of endosialidase